MDDLEIDRELQRGLAVSPSPDFVARVRATIADAPAPSIASTMMKASAPIAWAAVLAIVVGLATEHARSKPGRAETTSGVAGLRPSTTNTHPNTTNIQSNPTNIQLNTANIQPNSANNQHTTAASPQERKANVRAPHLRTVGVPTFGSADSVNEPPLPEVVIAHEDVNALRQFVTGAREVRFLASFAETPASTAWAVADLRVLPISVEPLDPVAAPNN